MPSDLTLYDRCRPSYPGPALAEVERICGLAPDAVVADIGSGTGIFAELLLARGYRVYGVEPLAEMREQAVSRVGRHPAYRSIAGSAESTGLPASTVDLITAASALHWFTLSTAQSEFRRILRGAKWVVALWNFRVPDASDFSRDFERLWRHHLGPPPAGNRQSIEGGVVPNFFGERQIHRLSFDNPLCCTGEALLGLLLSSSNAPPHGDQRRSQLEADAETLYRAYSTDGIVTVPYETVVYCCQIA